MSTENFMKISMPASRRGRVLVRLAGFLLLVGLVGAVILPPLVRHFAIKTLAEKLGRPVAIESIRINPYALSLTVRGLAIKDKDGTSEFVSFKELYVNVESQSLFRGGLVLKAFRLVDPHVKLVRLTEDRYSVSDLIDKFQAKPETEMTKPQSDPARFAFHNLELTGGRIEFQDQPKEKDHLVADINIGIPFLSNLPVDIETVVEPSFRATVNGAVLAVTGKTLPFKETRGAEVHLEAKDIGIPGYLAYVPMDLPVTVRSALLDLALDVRFEQPREGKPKTTLSGVVGLRELVVTESSGNPTLALARLSVELKRVDVFAPEADIARVTIESPEIHVARLSDGRFMPAALFQNKEHPARPENKQSEDKPAKQLAFSVAEFKVSDGKIFVQDEGVRPRLSTSFDLEIMVRDISSKPGSIMQVEAKASTQEGEKIGVTSSVRGEPLLAEGRIELIGLMPALYNSYVTPYVRAEISRGQIDFATNYRFEAAKPEARVSLADLSLAIKDFGIRKQGEKAEFLSLGSFAVSRCLVDLAAQTVSVEDLAVTKARLAAKRDSGGAVDLTGLVKGSGKTPVAAAAVPDKKDAVDSPWVVELKKLKLDDVGLGFEDFEPSEPARLRFDIASLQAENLSTAKGRSGRFNLSAAVNRKGKIAASGTAVIEPLSIAAEIDLKGVELLPFQPYMADHLNITLTQGAVATAGAVVFAKADDGIKVTFKGSFDLLDLYTVDNANTADFLKWKNLHISGIDFTLSPLKIAVDEVNLADFYSRLILNKEGEINLQHIVKKEGPAQTEEKTGSTIKNAETKPEAPQKEQSSPDSDIRIDRVVLQGGNINFTDNFIRPNYSVNFTNLGGRVTGLLSKTGTTADLELQGSVDQTAPVEIAGRINPLAKDLFLDMKIAIKGMEMSSFTPYSGRYIGYGIDKGKLSLDIAYKVKERKLEASNHIFLDQLTFGDKIESPDATKLPVLFAVSLLKNRRGEIDVNLPIGGSLDDPDFSVGGIILRVILNLITKAVTAPFSLLASAFGGGEQLAFVEFEPGRDVLTGETVKRLVTLAKALDDRPALKLETAGRVDLVADQEGLRKIALERKVKAQKFAELTRRGGEAPVSLEAVTLNPEEYPVYLEKVFSKAENIVKPKTTEGKAKPLSVEEMEKMLLVHEVVSQEVLRELAGQRSQAVKDYLVAKGGIPAERIFVVSPRMDGEPPKDGGKASRADFTLK